MIRNPLLKHASELKSSGVAVYDLSDTSYHRNGLRFPDELLSRYFAEYLHGRSYDPDPRGLPATRGAVARFFTERGIGCTASDVILSASTSDAYNMLFQSLCKAGDRVLLPRPCYPLFEHLCRYARLRIDYYDLDPDRGFAPDLSKLRRTLRRPASLLLAISPNNPAGSCLSASDWHALQSICAESRVVMVLDEVFSDLAWNHDAASGPTQTPHTAGAADREPVLFRLGGVSKLFASPDIKLSWIALTQAPHAQRMRMLDTLETARDMYLNSSGPSEYFAFRMLEEGSQFRRDLREAVRARTLIVDKALSACRHRESAAYLNPQQGGVHRVLRLPEGQDDEDAAMRLLREEHVLVHPGYMYGFQRGQYWVFSNISSTLTLERALPRVSRFLESLQPFRA
ncbi:MAG: pyridoxal phosphate-dependent aminotransferase [bacterium]